MSRKLFFFFAILLALFVNQGHSAEIKYNEIFVDVQMTSQTPISLNIRDYTRVKFQVADQTPRYNIQLVKTPDCAVELSWTSDAQQQKFFFNIGKADCKQASISLHILDGAKCKSPLITFNVSQAAGVPIKKDLTTSLSAGEIKLGESLTLKVGGGKPPYHVSHCGCTGASPSELNQCLKSEKVGEDTFKVTPSRLFFDGEKSSFMIGLSDSESNVKEVNFNVINPNWKPPAKARLSYVNYPDFKGMTRAEAEVLIKKEGFTKVTFVEAAPEMYTQVGKVIKQDPIPGMKTFQRTEVPNEDASEVRKQLYAQPIVLTIGSKGSFVPDVLLKSEAEAVDSIKKAGYVPEVVYYPETSGGMVGKVKNSDPLPQRGLPPGGRVKLMVGRSSFEMPNVIGTPLAHATANLDLISKGKALNLKYTVTTKDTPNMADDGKVFDQNPKAGAALAPGMAIALSAYRWVYKLPNFTGMTDREAFAALNQINSSRPGFIKLSATQTKDSSNPNDNDRIHDQNPKPGTVVQPGATAVFYTYKYKPSAQIAQAAGFVVPNVVGKSEKDAVMEMGKAKAKLAPTKYVASDKSNQGKVIAQSIPAGTKTAEAVSLTVGKK